MSSRDDKPSANQSSATSTSADLDHGLWIIRFRKWIFDQKQATMFSDYYGQKYTAHFFKYT